MNTGINTVRTSANPELGTAGETCKEIKWLRHYQLSTQHPFSPLLQTEHQFYSWRQWVFLSLPYSYTMACDTLYGQWDVSRTC